MSNITTVNQFTGSLYLPNVEVATRAEAIRLTEAIAKYEPMYLKTLLGYELYTLFTQGLIDLTQIYEDIRDGGTYEDTSGNTQEWEGFTDEGKNPIANFIYFYHRRDIATDTQGTGEYEAATENGSRFSPMNKCVEAWNEMVDMNKKLHAFLIANEDTYPEYRYFTNDIIWEYEALLTKINPYGI